MNKQTKSSCSVVLPCYNEADNLRPIAESFAACLPMMGDTSLQVVLVNNGSQDKSASVMKALTDDPKFGFLCTVNVEVNQGYGYGILKGVEASTGTYVGWTHADMQTSPEDVVKGFEVLRNAASSETTFLKGQRLGRPVFDDLFTRGMGLLSTCLLGARLHDINAQPKLFHRSFLTLLEKAPHDFSLDLYAYYQAVQSGMKLITIPVHFGKRIHGEAKGGGSIRGKIRLIRRTLAYMWQLRQDIRKGIR